MMFGRFRKLLGLSSPYSFEEGKEYYNEHSTRSFEVKEINRERNDMLIEYDYMDGKTIHQDLELYERKANKGIIYPLNDENAKSSSDKGMLGSDRE